MSKKTLLEVYEQKYSDYVEKLNMLRTRITEQPETALLDEMLAHDEHVMMIGMIDFMLAAKVIGVLKYERLLNQLRDRELEFSNFFAEVTV